MEIAITRLAEKGERDAETCARFGHTCRTVSPLQAELNASQVQTFVLEANNQGFDAVFFTSAYPAEKIAPLLSPAITKTCRVIAIGPATAAVLHSQSIKAETLPRYYSRDFAPYLGNWIEGKRIGLPRAAVPNPALIAAIENAGGIALEYRIYSLVATNTPLDLTGAGAIIFTSASSYTRALLPAGTRAIPVAIGEITADAMRAGGLPPQVTGDGSLPGTLTALNRYLEEHP